MLAVILALHAVPFVRSQAARAERSRGLIRCSRCGPCGGTASACFRNACFRNASDCQGVPAARPARLRVSSAHELRMSFACVST